MIELLALLGAIALGSLIYFVPIALVVKATLLILDAKINKIFVATYLISLAMTLLEVLSDFGEIREMLGW